MRSARSANGPGAMADYRVLWFDDAGGLTSAEWLEAQTDVEAVASLNSRTVRQRFEIWCDQRLLARSDTSHWHSGSTERHQS